LVMSSLIVMSKWNCSSSSTARSTPARSRSIHIKRRSPGMRVMGGPADGGLGSELAAALRGELIELRFAIVFGETPVGFEPAALFHAMEGGVERAFFYLEPLIGRVANPRRDGVAVSGAPGEGLEDEEVERALEEIEVGGAHGGCSPELLMGVTDGETRRPAKGLPGGGRRSCHQAVGCRRWPYFLPHARAPGHHRLRRGPGRAGRRADGGGDSAAYAFSPPHGRSA